MEGLHYGWGLPPNLSTYGPAIDHLIHVVHLFAAALFIGWGIFFIYCLIRFRAREGQTASYESTRTKIPKLIELGVIGFEAFLLIGLSYPIWRQFKVEFPPRDQSLTIRVLAQQFAWNIHYPGRDSVFGRRSPDFISDSNPIGLDLNDTAAQDDITTVNQLHFPVGKPVIAEITSMDVIHSFSIPVLRTKQDAIPGVVTPIWFEATKTAQFEIACAQLCGMGHTRMIGYVTVDTPEAYEAWVREQETYLTPSTAATQ